MRTVRVFLLLVYVAAHSGLPIPRPDGGLKGMCGCGESCRCSEARIAAGECCCSPQSPRCCSAKAKSCCSPSTARCCSPEAGSCCQTQAEQDQPPAFVPCHCQHDAPDGVAATSDPRMLPPRVAVPDSRTCDRLAAAIDLVAPLVTYAPDDPVPRQTV